MLCSSSQVVSFKKDIISLSIPKDGVTTADGWKITPTTHPGVNTISKAIPNKFLVSRPPPASHSITRISVLFVLQATIAVVEDLLTVTIYDLCCFKALLSWTIFELGDNRMSLCEFYHHISTCRNVYCKLCGCSTSLKYLLKHKFPATN